MADPITGLVSIVIPCYQQERFIAQALESVQQQTYAHWECIVIDDGSTDKTGDIAAEFVTVDERFRYVYKENAGVSVARNRGFGLAQGEFINFLDGDDLLRPEKIRRQVEYLRAKPEIDWCYCDHVHKYEERGVEEHYPPHPLAPNPLEDFLFHWDRGLSIPPHCGLFRRSIWGSDELPFAPDYGGRWEDWVFWIDLCLRGCHSAFMEQQDAVYRIHAGGISSDVQVAALNAIQAAFFIAPRVPPQFREQFLMDTISFHMERYASFRLQRAADRAVGTRLLRGMAIPIRKLLGPTLFSHLRRFRTW